MTAFSGAVMYCCEPLVQSNIVDISLLILLVGLPDDSEWMLLFSKPA